MANPESLPPDWWERHKVQLPAGQHGRWAIERFTVLPGTRLQPYFSVYGRECPPGDYTFLVYYEAGPPEIYETLGPERIATGQTFMTDTPGEIEDHREVMDEIARRGGRILIHGLGLGVIVKFALAQASVSHIDVVELDREVIALVAGHYADERLTVHHGDALTYKWPVGASWSVVWHDIWGDYRQENLKEMALLRRRFARRSDWQDCWSQAYLLANRKLR